jgi:hypothetical protein
MLVLRLLLVLVLIAVVVSVCAAMFTRDWRYLRLAWQIIKFTGVLLLIAAVLYALGRVILF